MPYKTEKYSIKDYDIEKDKRRRLTEKQRAEIKELYNSGWSLRGIAREYNTNHKVIGIICKPEYREKQHEYNSKHWHKYYDTKEHNKAMKKHRKYKHNLLKDLF